MQRTTVIAGIIDDIRRVFQVVHEQAKKAEHVTGLTSPQLWAIKTIAQESPIMVSEIARRMYLHPATIVGILDRLEKQELVIRVRSTEDRRVVKVELTVKGRALVKKAPEIAQDIIAEGLGKLPQRNLNKIATSLNQIVGFLGAQDKPAQLILSPEVNWPLNKKIRGSSSKRNV
jgi:DNA-binding MarR family transcriptional regulator